MTSEPRVYFVEEGEADVVTEEGAEAQRLGAGDTFGEIALLLTGPADGHGRGADTDAAPLALRAWLPGDPRTCTRARTRAASSRR